MRLFGHIFTASIVLPTTCQHAPRQYARLRRLQTERTRDKAAISQPLQLRPIASAGSGRSGPFTDCSSLLAILNHTSDMKAQGFCRSAEVWTRSALARHVREHARKAGHASLARAAKATVHRILAEQPLHPEKVKYGHQAHLEGKPITSGHCARWRSCGVLPRVRKSDESDILAILIGAQELADPIEAIKLRLEVTFRFLRLTNCSTTPVFVTATARVISGRRHRWAAYRSSKRPHSPSSMRQTFSSQARSRPEYRRRTTCRPS